ncbi:MAG: class I SAM-dependent methyltransferase [Desulfobacteraceae bacterium]|nr:class I SAM-dependent methyltransferase [Desulfobacteraceae bacterium]
MTDTFISPALYKKSEFYYSCANSDILGLIDGEPRKILDVGCAEGVLGEAVKKKYECEYVGIEIEREAAQKAEKRIDRVIIGNAEKTDLIDHGIPEKYFDFILYGDVLEHLYDPWTVLFNHGKYLKDGGHIVASIPNIRNLGIIQSLMSGNWTYLKEGILDSTHIRFFTLNEIRKMMKGCGFRLVEIRRDFHKLFDFEKIGGQINIDMPKMTIKNVSKAEALELSTVQFIVKAQKETVPR